MTSGRRFIPTFPANRKFPAPWPHWRLTARLPANSMGPIIMQGEGRGMTREEVFRALAQWGTSFSLEMIQGTAALYAPVALAPDEVRVTRDIAYGPHERHRLDLFRPEGSDP